MAIPVCPEDLHSTFPRSVPWEADLHGWYCLGSLSLCLPIIFGHWEAQAGDGRAREGRAQTVYFSHALPPWLYFWQWPHFSIILAPTGQLLFHGSRSYRVPVLPLLLSPLGLGVVTALCWLLHPALLSPLTLLASFK